MGSQELKDFSKKLLKGDTKFNAVKEIFASVQNETNGLFQLLLANKRFEILPAIASQFKRCLMKEVVLKLLL